MTMHPILIECVEEETDAMLLCTVAGKSVWIPKAAIWFRWADQDGDMQEWPGTRLHAGECDIKATIPLDLARQYGLIMGQKQVITPVAEPGFVKVGCRSCPASIIWVRTDRGRAMPLDAEPVEYGGNVVIREGVAVVLAKGEASLPGEKRWRPHWATCPASNAHRKPKSTDAAKTKAGKRKPADSKYEKDTTPNLFGE